MDDLHLLAIDLAQFLNELHQIDATGGPYAGPHNYYRGGSLAVYDAETRSTIAQLEDWMDGDAVISVWEKALSSKWNKNPIWIHGDFSAGNILVKDKATGCHH